MNFLISGMGGDMAQSISKIIKTEFQNAKVFGLDISNRNAALFFCDLFINAPLASDPGYINFIEQLIAEHKIEYFIPCTEHELRALNKLPANHPLWSKTICCSPLILSICLDKFETFQFLKSKHISIPWYTEDINQIKSFPCIYKKKSSSGSRDIFKVKDLKEAEFLIRFSPNGLFQEYLAGDENEYTCSIFQWEDGTFETIQLLRTLTGGSTSWAKVVKLPEIDQLCKEIAKAFNLNGSLNIQLRLTEKGPMIFEINPRFSSTVYMRHLLGYKDLTWSIQKLKKLPVNIPEVKIGAEAVKISEIKIFS